MWKDSTGVAVPFIGPINGWTNVLIPDNAGWLWLYYFNNAAAEPMSTNSGIYYTQANCAGPGYVTIGYVFARSTMTIQTLPGVRGVPDNVQVQTLAFASIFNGSCMNVAGSTGLTAISSLVVLGSPPALPGAPPYHPEVSP